MTRKRGGPCGRQRSHRALARSMNRSSYSACTSTIQAHPGVHADLLPPTAAAGAQRSVALQLEQAQLLRVHVHCQIGISKLRHGRSHMPALPVGRRAEQAAFNRRWSLQNFSNKQAASHQFTAPLSQKASLVPKLGAMHDKAAECMWVTVFTCWMPRLRASKQPRNYDVQLQAPHGH